MAAASTEASPTILERIGRYVPILTWGRSYNQTLLRTDLIAGLTIAAFAIPENMAYASLAGVAPQIGIYASIAAMVAYTLFGTSRQMAVGVTSALSIMVAGSLGAMAFDNDADYLAAASFVAVAAGVIAVAAGLFKLGFVVNFISESVLTGFSAGAALFIASSQVAKLFGIPGVDGNFFERVSNVIRNIGDTNGWSLGLGLACIAALLLLEKFLPRLPAALLVVIVAIFVQWQFDLDEHGVDTTGKIPQGLPVPEVPWVDASIMPALISLGFGCFLLSYIEGVGTARTFAARYKYQIDANQELYANGAMNLSSGLFQGYVTGGSMSRSAVNDEAGAKTPAVGLFAAAIMIIVLLFLTGPFQYLPEPTLAAIVLVAVRGLIDIPALQRLYRLSMGEFLAAMAAMAGVLVFGMLEGIIIGVLFSFLTLLKRATSPRTTVLGYLPESGAFVAADIHPEAETIPGVLVFRPQAGLFYANAPVVKADLLEALDAETRPISMVLLDLSATPMIDLGSVESLVETREELEARNIELRIVSEHRDVGEVIERAGHGDILVDATEHETVKAYVDTLVASQETSSINHGGRQRDDG